MTIKLAFCLVTATIALALLSQACGFGGGGGNKSLVTAGRPGSIATATPPANPPAPIVLGESQGVGTTTTGGGGAAAGSYVVKSGDTLGSIATQSGVPSELQAAWIVDVLRLNGIEDARLLQAGQELQLPKVPTPAVRPTTATTGTPPTGSTPSVTATTGSGANPTATGASTTATPRPSPTTTTGGGTYTVQSGDYPYLIAGKLGVPDAQQAAWVALLVSLNNIDPSGLSVGQILQLPPNTPGR